MSATTEVTAAHDARAARLRTAFHVVAIAEAVSWAGLLIGMLFKYVIADNEVGVTVFGPVHGAVFVAYVIVVLVVFRPLRWRWSTTVLALVASVPPLCTLLFSLWARRSGRL